jgi:hypothetical protein
MCWTGARSGSGGAPEVDRPDDAGSDARDHTATSRRLPAKDMAKSASRSTVSGRTERSNAIPRHNGQILQDDGVLSPRVSLCSAPHMLQVPSEASSVVSEPPVWSRTEGPAACGASGPTGAAEPSPAYGLGSSPLLWLERAMVAMSSISRAASWATVPIADGDCSLIHGPHFLVHSRATLLHRERTAPEGSRYALRRQSRRTGARHWATTTPCDGRPPIRAVRRHVV